MIPFERGQRKDDVVADYRARRPLTDGEIAARCDKEEANFLAINLADDVAKGRRTVDDARKFYAESMMATVVLSAGSLRQRQERRTGRGAASGKRRKARRGSEGARSGR